MKEIWKDIKGYGGRYQVSNMGRVRSFARGAERILKPDYGYGYYRVSLQKNKEVKRTFVHRLVADAFLENPNNLPIINHKDENRGNNNVENLEWCTQKYNLNYGTRNEKLSARAKRVGQFSLSGELIEVHRSVMIAAKKLGYDYGLIYKCCRDEIKKVYGFVWKYI